MDSELRLEWVSQSDDVTPQRDNLRRLSCALMRILRVFSPNRE